MRPKRTRNFARKAKTGCRTCRIRRVKCDEQMPVCQRCSSTGRNCDGYDLPVISQPITQLWDEREERRLFYTFRTVTSEHFSRQSEPGFWSRLVLQACHVNQPLRHAAIALACLHEDFVTDYGNEKRRNFALQQYTKALAGMRTSLVDEKQSVLITIMGSALCFCFESLQSQFATAVMHIRNGLSIVSSFDIRQTDSTANWDVLRVLAQLGFQANYFVDKTDHAQLVHQVQSIGAPLHREISNFEEIKSSLYVCLNETMFSGYSEEASGLLDSFGTHYHMTNCAQIILFGQNNPQFISGKETATLSLRKWRLSFDKYLHAQDGHTNVQALTLLKLHHLVAVMMLTTTCGSSVEAHNLESVLGDFKQIIEYSKELVGSQPTLPVLSPDIGIIAPLFFVATVCRASDLRDEAKKILALRHRREGMWDSEIAVKTIEDLKLA